MAPLLFILGFCALLKGREVYILLFLILLLTDGLGVLGQNDFILAPIKYFDLGLILLGCWFVVKLHFRKISKPPLPLFLLFIAYLVAIIAFDYWVNGTSPVSIIKTYRHWSILLFLFFYRSIRPRAIVKCLHILLYLTLILSIILIIEFIFGIQITNAGRVGFTNSAGDYHDRGAFGTTYNLLFILLLMTPFFKISRNRRVLYLSILCVVYINSITRSTIMVTAGSMFVLYWWIHNKSAKFLLKGIALLSIAGLIIFSIPTIKDRFFGEKQEGGMTIGEREGVGTLGFRLLLMEERFSYLMERPLQATLGIGGVHESEFRHKQIFEVGLSDEEGNVAQLDTGDIAWPVLFFRLGLLGTLLYLCAYIQLILQMGKSRSTFSKVMVIYLVGAIFFLSFVSGNLIQATFIIMPLLGLSLSTKNHLRKRIIVKSVRHNYSSRSQHNHLLSASEQEELQSTSNIVNRL